MNTRYIPLSALILVSFVSTSLLNGMQPEDRAQHTVAKPTLIQSDNQKHLALLAELNTNKKYYPAHMPRDIQNMVKNLNECASFMEDAAAKTLPENWEPYRERLKLFQMSEYDLPPSVYSQIIINNRNVTLKGDTLEASCLRKHSLCQTPSSHDELNPFDVACLRGNNHAIQAFLSHGQEVNLPADSHDFCPLYYAVLSQNLSAVQLLLNAGADAHRVASSTSVLGLICNGHFQFLKFPHEYIMNVTKMLLNYSRDINKKNLHNSSLLDLASVYYPALVPLLFDKEATCNEVSLLSVFIGYSNFHSNAKSDNKERNTLTFSITPQDYERAFFLHFEKGAHLNRLPRTHQLKTINPELFDFFVTKRIESKQWHICIKCKETLDEHDNPVICSCESSRFHPKCLDEHNDEEARRPCRVVSSCYCSNYITLF